MKWTIDARISMICIMLILTVFAGDNTEPSIVFHAPPSILTTPTSQISHISKNLSNLQSPPVPELATEILTPGLENQSQQHNLLCESRTQVGMIY